MNWNGTVISAIKREFDDEARGRLSFFWAQPFDRNRRLEIVATRRDGRRLTCGVWADDRCPVEYELGDLARKAARTLLGR